MKKPMQAPIKEEKNQVSPLAHTNIKQLVDHLESMSEEAKPEPAQKDEASSQSQLQGWQLASGLELLRWKATILETIVFERIAEPNYPVWSILLSDSTNLVATTGQPLKPVQENRNGMIYLYNHHLSLDVGLEGPGKIQVLTIRLKPDAWLHLLQNPPSHVSEFINDNRPRFHGFDLQGVCAEYFQQLLRDDVETDDSWFRLQATLGICNHVFSQLGERAPVASGSFLRSRDSQRIHKARTLLLQDFQKPLSLAEIGSQVGLGRDKLRQLFQQVYGTTPNKYYQQQRMQEARRLMLKEDFSAMDAGFQVGYSHLGHFAQAFKKQFGCLPKDCKKGGERHR